MPAATARVAHAAFPTGHAYLRLADMLGPIFHHPTFADLSPHTGQPAADPAQLALVTLFQCAEGLSDRQAAAAVRARIDWKDALALLLEDSGFHASVLVKVRARLLAGGAEQRLVETVLTCLKEHGFVTARGNQRTDATPVLAAIQVLNRRECGGEPLRHPLTVLAPVAPAWLQGWVPPAWFDRSGQRLQDYRLPKGKDERERLAAQTGAAGRQVPAVRVLRRVGLEQDDADEPIRWRVATDLPQQRACLVRRMMSRHAAASNGRRPGRATRRTGPRPAMTTRRASSPMWRRGPPRRRIMKRRRAFMTAPPPCLTSTRFAGGAN